VSLMVQPYIKRVMLVQLVGTYDGRLDSNSLHHLLGFDSTRSCYGLVNKESCFEEFGLPIMSVLQSLVSTLNSTAASRTAPTPAPLGAAVAVAIAVAVAGAEAEAPGLRNGLPAMEISGLILASLSDHADATLVVFIQDDHQAMDVEL